MDGARRRLRAELRELFARDRAQLLPALHHLQHTHGYLPDWALEVVSWHLGVPASEVYGAATSYSELRTMKPGRHVIRVCTGLTCRVSGSDAVLGAVRERLGIDPGETTGNGPGGSVTLETTPCGFLCAAAPAIEVGGRWKGHVTPGLALRAIGALRGRGGA